MNLKDLSAKLGLSQTTVSRALDGYPEVSNKTKQRVLDAAKQYNYSPNMRARRLATGRSMAIGHVLPVSAYQEILNPMFPELISGSGEIYAANGYELVLSVVDDVRNEEVYRDLVARGAVDGVVVHSPRVEDSRIELLSTLGLPFVVHGRSTNISRPYNWIDVNNRRSFFRATTFLLDLGHRSIGLINGMRDMDFADRRLKGYLDALQERGLQPVESMISHDKMTESYGFDAARNMLGLASPPTAFVVSSIIPAIGVRRAVEEAGMKLGRDVSVVIHDDHLSYFQNDVDIPIFTGVRSSIREAGKLIAEMLLGIIDGSIEANQTRLLEAELIVGHSTGPAPSSR